MTPKKLQESVLWHFYVLLGPSLYVTIVDIHQYIYTIIAICDPNKRV